MGESGRDRWQAAGRRAPVDAGEGAIAGSRSASEREHAPNVTEPTVEEPTGEGAGKEQRTKAWVAGPW